MAQDARSERPTCSRARRTAGRALLHRPLRGTSASTKPGEASRKSQSSRRAQEASLSTGTSGEGGPRSLPAAMAALVEESAPRAFYLAPVGALGFASPGNA